MYSTIHAISPGAMSNAAGQYHSVVAFKITYTFGHTVEEVFFYEPDEGDSEDPSHVTIDVSE